MGLSGVECWKGERSAGLTSSPLLYLVGHLVLLLKFGLQYLVGHLVLLLKILMHLLLEL